VALPIAVTAAVAVTPAPEGLAESAWLYFAIFTGVIAALVVEPLPNPAVGLVGLTLVGVLSPRGVVHQSPVGAPRLQAGE
jgi:L-tartrate/succinate antiporter